MSRMLLVGTEEPPDGSRVTATALASSMVRVPLEGNGAKSRPARRLRGDESGRERVFRHSQDLPFHGLYGPPCDVGRARRETFLTLLLSAHATRCRVPRRHAKIVIGDSRGLEAIVDTTLGGVPAF